MTNPAVLQPFASRDDVLPRAPASLAETGLAFSFLIELVTKVLFLAGEKRLAELAQHVRLAPTLIDPVLSFMRGERLCEVTGRGELLGDASYRLTDAGRERAGEFLSKCEYSGPAPVTIGAYAEQVRRQSVAGMRVTASDMAGAFDGIVMPPHLMEELGSAMNSGRAVFVYGPAGAGKTFLAQRLAALLHGEVAVPYAVAIDHQVMQVFDPLVHAAAGDSIPHATPQRRLDARWRLCRRPVALSGGELTLDMLNVRFDAATRVHHAPPHLKANNGLYIIDDLGRQMVSAEQLLGRWIVPMDQGVDYQALNNGHRFTVPFDVILVFSSNMSPDELADPAFLRRLGHKIHVGAIDEEQYRSIFTSECAGQGVAFRDDAYEYLLREYHEREGMPLLACYPRDLLAQIRARAVYHGVAAELTCTAVDHAWRSYFAAERA
jgi:hypothetical protein